MFMYLFEYDPLSLPPPSDESSAEAALLVTPHYRKGQTQQTNSQTVRVHLGEARKLQATISRMKPSLIILHKKNHLTSLQTACEGTTLCHLIHSP